MRFISDKYGYKALFELIIVITGKNQVLNYLIFLLQIIVKETVHFAIEILVNLANI